MLREVWRGVAAWHCCVVTGRGCWRPGPGVAEAYWPAAGVTGADGRFVGWSAGCFAGWLAVEQGL